MVADVNGEVLAGGWRLLCVGVMHQAVARIEAEGKVCKVGSRYRMHGASGLDKERLHQRVQAREWLKGGVGLVSFEDCCEALGVDPERARNKILARAHERRRKPMREREVA
jgi:hypothetical protein